MRVLILGGSGFLGTHVVDRFVADGHEVFVYDLSGPRFRKHPPGVHSFIGDLRNVGTIEAAISTGFDAVLHFISATSPRSSNESPEFDIQANVIGTVHLLDICRRHNVGKVVFLSSGGTVYGNIGADVDVDEAHPVQPICSYGITKLCIEHYLHMYRRLYGLDYVALRIANPYGEHQNPHVALGAVNVFMYRVIKGLPIEVWGDGSIERDFIYAGDVADAVYRATVRHISGIFNVGSGEGVPLHRLIEDVARATAMEPKVVWLKERPFDVPRIVLNSNKLQQAVGWRCQTSREEGMARTAEWIRATPSL